MQEIPMENRGASVPEPTAWSARASRVTCSDPFLGEKSRKGELGSLGQNKAASFQVWFNDSIFYYMFTDRGL